LHPVYDFTFSYMQHDVFICVPRLIHCATQLIHIYAKNSGVALFDADSLYEYCATKGHGCQVFADDVGALLLHVLHDSCICVCDTASSRAWCDLFMCILRDERTRWHHLQMLLVHCLYMCDVMYSCECSMTRSCVWCDLFMHILRHQRTRTPSLCRRFWWAIPTCVYIHVWCDLFSDLFMRIWGGYH